MAPQDLAGGRVQGLELVVDADDEDAAGGIGRRGADRAVGLGPPQQAAIGRIEREDLAEAGRHVEPAVAEGEAAAQRVAFLALAGRPHPPGLSPVLGVEGGDPAAGVHHEDPAIGHDRRVDQPPIAAGAVPGIDRPGLVERVRQRRVARQVVGAHAGLGPVAIALGLGTKMSRSATSGSGSMASASWSTEIRVPGSGGSSSSAPNQPPGPQAASRGRMANRRGAAGRDEAMVSHPPCAPPESSSARLRIPAGANGSAASSSKICRASSTSPRRSASRPLSSRAL